ncbi:MAG: ribosome silencing factor [Gammaproteobacteria bacterium]
MLTKPLKNLIIKALEDLKGKNIIVLDVTELTPMTDIMIICTGTSNRHVKSLAKNVVERAKKRGEQPLGIEGEREGDWILIDLNSVVVHVMLAEVRTLYSLEKLWSCPS